MSSIFGNDSSNVLDGSIDVSGTTMTVETKDLTINDNLVKIAINNTSDVINTGLYGRYGSTYSGLVKAKTGKENYLLASTTEPTTTNDITSMTLGNFHCDQITANNIPAGGVVDLTSAQTLSNKTLTAPILTGTTNADNLTLTGDLTVNGTTTTLNVNNLDVEDPLILYGSGNTADIQNLGVLLQYNDGADKYGGLVRDKTTKEFYLFEGAGTLPTTTSDITILSKSKLNADEINAGTKVKTDLIQPATVNGNVCIKNDDNKEVCLLDGAFGRMKFTDVNILLDKDSNLTFENLAGTGVINQWENNGDIIKQFISAGSNGYLIQGTGATPNIVQFYTSGNTRFLNDNATGADWANTDVRIKGSMGVGGQAYMGNVDIDGDLTINGNVDGRDVSVDGLALDNLNTTIGLGGLTSGEVNQLKNIDAKTVSNAQWGYLGDLDQDLATSNNVSFNQAVGGDIKITGNTISTITTDSNLTLQGNGTGEVLLTKDPVSALGVATKQYIDALSVGVVYKSAVRAVSNGVLPAYTQAGTGVGATLTADAVGILTLDGKNIVLNDRVLIKDAVDAKHNGIYTMTTEGTAGVAYVLTRATDADNSPQAELVSGSSVLVLEGTAFADAGFVLCTSGFEAVDIDVEEQQWCLFINPSGGSINTASNVGVGGVGMFKQLASKILEFKNINAGSSKISITDDVANNEVDVDINEGNVNILNLSGAPASTVVGISDTQTLTNKTINDCSGNTFSVNILEADLIQNNAFTDITIKPDTLGGNATISNNANTGGLSANNNQTLLYGDDIVVNGNMTLNNSLNSSGTTLLDGLYSSSVIENSSEYTGDKYGHPILAGYNVGGYSVLASTELSALYRAYYGTDRDNTTSWRSSATYDGFGSYIGSVSTGNGVLSYAGEWLQIKLDSQKQMKGFQLRGYAGSTQYRVFGSNTGLVDSWTSIFNTIDILDPNTYKEHNFASNQTYQYFRVVLETVPFPLTSCEITGFRLLLATPNELKLTAINNIIQGQQPLLTSITTGTENIAMGKNVLTSNNTGDMNIVLGQGSCNGNLSGSDNIILGRNNFNLATIKSNNIVIGENCAINLNTNENVIIGSNNLDQSAGYSTGSIVVIGKNNIRNLNSGANTFALGFNIAQNATGGDCNVYYGCNLASGMTTGSDNVCMGSNILLTGNPTHSVVLGRDMSGAINSNSFYVSSISENTGVLRSLRYNTSSKEITYDSPNAFASIGHNAVPFTIVGTATVEIGATSCLTLANNNMTVVSGGGQCRLKVDHAGFYRMSMFVNCIINKDNAHPATTFWIEIQNHTQNNNYGTRQFLNRNKDASRIVSVEFISQLALNDQIGVRCGVTDAGDEMIIKSWKFSMQKLQK